MSAGVHGGSHRPSTALLVAWSAGRGSAWATTLGLSLVAYDRGGAGAVGLLFVVRMVPAGLAAPGVSLLADRIPRRQVLLIGLWLRVLLMALLALAVTVGTAFVVVLLLAAAAAVVETAHRPAHVALLVELAPDPRRLSSANVATSSGDYVGFLAGSVAAGALAGGAGPAAPLVLAAVAAAVAALVVLLVPRTTGPHRARTDVGTITEQLVVGLREVAANPDQRLLATVLLVDLAVQSMVEILLVVAALELLGTGGIGAGLLAGAWGLGGLVGGLAALALLRRTRIADGLLAGLLLAGVPLALVGPLALPASALGLLALVGVGFAVIEVGLLTLTQRLSAGDVLARVFGVHELLSVLGTALGAVLAPTLVAWFGVSTALAVTGTLLPAVAVLRWVRLRRLGATVVAPVEVYVQLRRVETLRDLPGATVETLALRADRRALAEGERLIAEGDVGDELYVLVEGELVASASGQGELAVLGPGDHVGEIALLRDQPRSATVVARVASEVLVLDRDTFLDAVTGHTGTHGAALAVAEQRLAHGGG